MEISSTTPSRSGNDNKIRLSHSSDGVGALSSLRLGWSTTDWLIHSLEISMFNESKVVVDGGGVVMIDLNSGREEEVLTTKNELIIRLRGWVGLRFIR